MSVTMQLTNGVPTTKKVQPPTPGQAALGWCLEGMEDVGTYQAGPGIVWPQPGLSDLRALVSVGGNLVRLPISWSALQQSNNAPISTFYMGCVETFVEQAASLGVGVIVDLHNFGYAPNGALVGSAAAPVSVFANVWSQIAKVLVGKPGVVGYDLSNEPKLDQATWTAAAQAAISAIRLVDTETYIVLEGIGWDNPEAFLDQITDPAGRVIASAHAYAGGSGTGYDWTTLGSTIYQVSQALAPFFAGCEKAGLPTLVGETGAGNNNTGWLMLLVETVQAAIAAKSWLTLWSAGPGWAQTPPNVYPYFCGEIGGRMMPQSVVLQGLGGFAPTIPAGEHPIVSGTGVPGSRVYLTHLTTANYLSDQATETVGADGTWTHTVGMWQHGANFMVASDAPMGKNTIGQFDPLAVVCFEMP